MAHHSRVPKFGNWESEDDVPYTVYFDKARKDRSGGKVINPNDPQENPDMFPNIAPPAQAPPSRARNEPEEPIGQQAVRPTHGRRVSWEEDDLRQFNGDRARNDNMGRGVASGPTHQRRGGHRSGSGRPVRQSAGSEHSIERSPLHPQYQAKVMGKGSGYPSGERKNSYESSHGAHGQSRKKPVAQGDESPNKGAEVPRFGDWDESNPSSADNYTHIFNRVRVERKNQLPNISAMDTKASYTNERKPSAQDNQKSCCFPWCRK